LYPPCFSLARALALCHLHSFPTRRSSDLPRRIRCAGHFFASFSQRGTRAPGGQAAARCGTASSSRRVAQLTRGCAEERFSIREADRKSTRLNSSHQIISYAVFCLKKKKRT